METRQEVAAAIGITDRRLCSLLYGSQLRRKYTVFSIPKSNGSNRAISAPHKHILWMQRQLLRLLQSKYDLKDCVHGFVKGRNIVTNAASHVRRRHIVNIDLADFFPSITLPRVVGIFKNHPFHFGNQAATVIAQICCRDDGVLPQGGAMSPLISNLAARQLDNRLLAFARKHKLRYSRYADDLTFSSNSKTVPQDLIILNSPLLSAGGGVTHAIVTSGFVMNNDKIRYRNNEKRQEVTGVTVNDFTNVTRRFVRSVQGALHAWEVHGYENALATFQSSFRNGKGISLENVLRGKLAFLKMVRGQDDYITRRLSRRFNRLSSMPICVPNITSLNPSRLRSRIPASLGWNVWSDRYRDAIGLLEISRDNGDKFAGTAFCVGPGLLATAGHNLFDISTKKVNDVSIFHESSGATIKPLTSSSKIESGLDIGMLRCEPQYFVKAIPTQLRLPEVGESILAIGYPSIPQREAVVVAHAGYVEALPISYLTRQRFIQVSFQSGGGLSGGCLIDRAGFVLGIMIENVFMQSTSDAPQKPYGQALPMEYFDDALV